MRRNIILAMAVLGVAFAAYAADTADRWNTLDMWGTVNPTTSTNVGARTWYNPTTTGVSGTLEVRKCQTNSMWAEPASSGVGFDVYKCSVAGTKDDSGVADCSKVNATEWDATGGTVTYVSDFIRLDINTQDAAARIVHQCGG